MYNMSLELCSTGVITLLSLSTNKPNPVVIDVSMISL